MGETHSITWRLATQDEIERTSANASLIDGAGAVLRDGELVGICDEYGTCQWCGIKPPPDSVSNPAADAIERLNEAATDLCTATLRERESDH